jgi:site-specific DNA recombinase
VTVIEEEAEVIRECARRTLAGESLSSIARDLEARGVETPRAAGLPFGT